MLIMQWVFLDYLTKLQYLYTLPQKKWWGITVCYTLRTVWVSFRPSISASFPDFNLSSFLPIFFSMFAWTLISGRSGLGLQMG